MMLNMLKLNHAKTMSILPYASMHSSHRAYLDTRAHVDVKFAFSFGKQLEL